jgi:GAF domain-containing protein
MTIKAEKPLDDLRQTLAGTDSRQAKAERAAGIIRRAGGYRWVGLYDVSPADIAVVAWQGPAPPTHPRFPRSQGLNGAAVASGSPVIVPDVSTDPRYLTTIGGTRAEMIVPVKDGDGRVVGTIDVESEQTNAFSESDRTLLEGCAEALRPLWS